MYLYFLNLLNTSDNYRARHSTTIIFILSKFRNQFVGWFSFNYKYNIFFRKTFIFIHLCEIYMVSIVSWFRYLPMYYILYDRPSLYKNPNKNNKTLKIYKYCGCKKAFLTIEKKKKWKQIHSLKLVVQMLRHENHPEQ